jgi:uncharacterized integral membrane protein
MTMKIDPESEHEESGTSWFRRDVVRIRLLWVGLVTSCLILLNDFRYVMSSPLYVIFLGFTINGILIVAFVLELRKTYKRLRDKRTLGDDKSSLS